MKCIIITLLSFVLSVSVYSEKEETVIQLPKPAFKGTVSVEECLKNRRSRRSYRNEALSLNNVGQILWAAQGISDSRGLRTAPSAGAMYPLETYLIVGDVEGIEPGLYHYSPSDHALTLEKKGDLRQQLTRAAWGQNMVSQAPANIIFTAIYERTTRRYGDRGIRYVHMDVGHAGENVHLQAESLGLATVVIGAFNDSAVAQVIGKSDEHPLYIMPIGKKK